MPQPIRSHLGATMGRTFTRNVITLMLLMLPLSLWADSNLDYQNRGDRFEGVRPKPVSGYDIELISVLVDYQEPVTQLPDQLRVAFHLQGQTAVTGYSIGSTRSSRRNSGSRTPSMNSRGRQARCCVNWINGSTSTNWAR
jgi:hypothetical protein